MSGHVRALNTHAAPTLAASFMASRRRPTDEPPDPSSLAPPDGDRWRARAPLILVVEDHDDTRELYANALREAGYRVEVAAEGREALQRIADWKPSVVLMDLSMPGVDGWEATRRIKANAATEDVVVIAVTAHATKLGLAQVEDFGAERVLSKPCLPQEIVSHVTASLSRRCHIVVDVEEKDDAPANFKRCERTPVFRVGLACVCEHHYNDALTEEQREVAEALDVDRLH